MSKEQSRNELNLSGKIYNKKWKIIIISIFRFLAPQSIPCSRGNENLNHENEGYLYNYNSSYDSGSSQNDEGSKMLNYNCF